MIGTQSAHHPDFIAAANAAKARIRQLTPGAARALVETGAVLIDVREKCEYQQSHLNSAIHISRGLLEMRINDIVPDKTTPIICYCTGGNRGAMAADTLQSLGYKNVFSIEGGMNACTCEE